MTDNEILLAMSNMLDPIREDVLNIREGLRDVKEDVQNLKEDVQNLKEDMQNLKEDMQTVKEDVQDIKVRVKKIEITQENEILPRLNTIESCYTLTYGRYKDSVEDYAVMKQDMAIVKKVVAEHSEKLQRIG